MIYTAFNQDKSIKKKSRVNLQYQEILLQLVYETQNIDKTKYSCTEDILNDDELLKMFKNEINNEMSLFEIKQEIRKYCIEPMTDNDEQCDINGDIECEEDDDDDVFDADFVDFRQFSDELRTDFTPFFEFENPNNPNLESINSEEYFSKDRNPLTQNNSAKHKRVSFTKTGDYGSKSKKTQSYKIRLTQKQPTNLMFIQDFIKYYIDADSKEENDEELKVDTTIDKENEYSLKIFEKYGDIDQSTYNYQKMIALYNVNMYICKFRQFHKIIRIYLILYRVI